MIVVPGRPARPTEQVRGLKAHGRPGIAPDAGRRKKSGLRGSARSDPLFANLGAADDASSDECEEWEHTGIHQCADQDFDRDRHQERENRAEEDSHGNRPYGPGWETAHANYRSLNPTTAI